MKTIALISGGKDSILSMLAAYRYGHEAVVVVNMTPSPSQDCAGADVPDDSHEIDSYMFQTVGHEVVALIARCLQLPLRRSGVCRGQAKDQSLQYSARPESDDEVEELYRLLKVVKDEFPEVCGVTTGAILSNYQRHRVEAVCGRLGLVSLAYLWQRKAAEVLDMITELHVKAILVKTASIGLAPSQLLGKTLEEARPTLARMEGLYGAHMAGEGGEFETIVLDCPLFAESFLEVTHVQPVIVDANEYSPSGHCILEATVCQKDASQRDTDATILARLRSPDGFFFPSDRSRFLPRVEELRRCAASVAPVEVQQTDLQNFYGDWETASSRIFSSVAIAGDPSHVLMALTQVMGDIQSYVAKKAREPFLYWVQVPDLSYVPLLNQAYTAAVPAVNPPCRVVTCSPSEVVSILVVSAPKATSERNALHNQSRSTWAAGCVGPYAQANSVKFSDDRASVLVGAVRGIVPATWLLAQPADLAGLPSAGDVAAARSFMAEFAFAYANAAAYNAYFSKGVEEVTHLTVLLCDARHAAAVPWLWQWCSGESVARVVLRVICVDKLEDDAQVALLLECRQVTRVDSD